MRDAVIAKIRRELWPLEKTGTILVPPLNFVKIEDISRLRISFESSLHLLSGHNKIKVVVQTRRKLWPSEISDFDSQGYPLDKQWYPLGASRHIRARANLGYRLKALFICSCLVREMQS